MDCRECQYPSALIHRLLYADRYPAATWPDDFFERTSLFDRIPEHKGKRELTSKMYEAALNDEPQILSQYDEFEFAYLLEVTALALDNLLNRKQYRGYSIANWLPETIVGRKIKRLYANRLVKKVVRLDSTISKRICYSVLAYRYRALSIAGTHTDYFACHWKQIDNEVYAVVDMEFLRGGLREQDLDGVKLDVDWQRSRPAVGFHVDRIYEDMYDAACASCGTVTDRVLSIVPDYSRPGAVASTDRDGQFIEPLNYHHIAFALIEESPDLSYEQWTDLNRLVEAADQLYQRGTSGRNTFAPNADDYRELLKEFTGEDTLRRVFKAAERDGMEPAYLDWRPGDEVIVRSPDREVPALRTQSPSDLEQLPCFKIAAKQLELPPAAIEIDVEATVADMVRTLRAVHTDFSDAEIVRYFELLDTDYDILPMVRTQLGHQWAEIPKGCTHRDSELVNRCVGWDACPYRITGSLRLRPSVYHRLAAGRRADQ